MGSIRLTRSFQALALLAGVAGVCGCATLRLNGCRKLATCGELGAYVCGDDLVCATRDGQTLHSELVSGSGNPCRICASGI